MSNRIRGKVLGLMPLVITGLIIFSCDSNAFLLANKHEKLLSFDYRFLRDFTEKESDDYESTFEKKTIHPGQKGDTLIVSVELPWNGCANIDSDIKVQGDSLLLEYWLKEDKFCTELIYYQLKYKILNPEKVKYKIGLKYVKEE